MENAAAAPAKPSLTKKPLPSSCHRNGSVNALRLRRVFDLFDRNGDGEITLDEMASALGLGADRSGLEAAVGGYIPVGAAGLHFDDFESLHRALGDALFGPIPEAEDEGNAFRVFDEDGDGLITAAELQAVHESVDRDRDHRIYNVIMKLMRKQKKAEEVTKKMEQELEKVGNEIMKTKEQLTKVKKQLQKAKAELMSE